MTAPPLDASSERRAVASETRNGRSLMMFAYIMPQIRLLADVVAACGCWSALQAWKLRSVICERMHMHIAVSM